MALSTKKNQSISALLSGKTIFESARQANVGERTLKRWLAEDFEFKQKLRGEQDQIVAAATRNLVILMEIAISTLVEIMKTGQSGDSNRRLAAEAIIRSANTALDRREIEDRLKKIEKSLGV
jgi:uncharacterized protein YeeX (DUF496 family)